MVRSKLKESNYKMEINEDIKNMDIGLKILYCLLMGYQDNLAFLHKKKGNNLYRTKHSEKEAITISKSSFVYNNSPKMCFYYELFMSMGSSDINIVSKVPDKLKELI